MLTIVFKKILDLVKVGWEILQLPHQYLVIKGSVKNNAEIRIHKYSEKV